MGKEKIKEGPGNEIDLFLQEMEKAFFTGTILVQQKDEKIICKGYGKADHSRKNTSETIFHVASITKQFTAAAIMLLVEEGKIELQESINTYLPSRFTTDEWEEITVEQLLTHTSGIPNYADWDDYWEICENLTVDKIIKEVQEQGLLFPPGQECCYSNTGYTLLGKIIEKQGEMPYRDFIKKRLLLPAGMTSSGIHSKSSVPTPEASAVGYWVDNQQLVKDPRDEFAILYSDGGLFSTVEDLAKWSKVLDGKTEVLKEHSVHEMIKNEYGLMSDKIFGKTMIHHNGSMAGFRSEFCKIPEEDLLIILLGNNADFVVDYLRGKIVAFLLGKQNLPKVIPFPNDFDYTPLLKKMKSRETDETITFKLQNKFLLFGKDSPSECFLLSNKRIFIPSEGYDFAITKKNSVEVFDENNVKCDVWSSPSIMSKILNLIKKLFS